MHTSPGVSNTTVTVEPPTATHAATFERVVRFAGARHFGYDVECPCGFKCSRHYAAGPAARCAVRHDRAARKQGAVSQGDDGCYEAGAVDTPGLHRPDCNAIRNGGTCDVGRGAVS